jgi:predicted acetyltransferase
LTQARAGRDPVCPGFRLSGVLPLLNLQQTTDMPISVRDSRYSPGDRKWMESVYRDYLDDLAPLSTGLFPILPEFGHREPDQLASWFADSSAHLLTICKESQPVGFAMVRTGQVIAGRGPVDYSMAEFFVARPWRRLGAGQEAVRLILDRFAGRWHIMEYLRNPQAVAFWRRVVSGYTGGQYQERAANGEIHQYFDSRTKAKR